MKIILKTAVLTVIISMMSVQQLWAVLPAGVVAYWNFDDVYDADADTTATDGSGNGHDVIWQNPNTTPDWQQGVLGGAVHFPGGSADLFARNYFETAGSITQLASAPNLATGMSISAWINPDAGVGGYDGVVMTRSASNGASNTLNFGIAVEASGDPAMLNVDTRAGGQAVDGTVGAVTSDNADVNTANGWQHVLWTWDNQSGGGPHSSVYVNGALDTQGDTFGFFFEILTDGGQWAVGADVSNPADRIFDGLVDDVAIFNTILTAADATNIYNDGIAGTNLDGGTYPGVGQGTDFNSILSNYRSDVGSRAAGDLNYDAFVDASDFRLFRDNNPPPVGAVNVPEPSSLVLLTLAAFGGFSIRRKVSR